jgi:hypothetical protein
MTITDERVIKPQTTQPAHLPSEPVSVEPNWTNRTPNRSPAPQAILQLQRMVGNQAVLRRLQSGDIQRVPGRRPPPPTPEEVEAQDRVLAQELVNVIDTQGGLNLALYMINLTHTEGQYQNDDEFLTQASQYAQDHRTFGLRDGHLARGVPISIDEAVSAEAQHVVAAANALLARFPDLYEGDDPPTVQVQTLNIFSHGDKTVLEAGHTTNRSTNRWVGAATFVHNLAQYLTSTPTINLYACNTAGTVAGSGTNFATAVQQQLTRDLQQRDGDRANVEVWGHMSARHTTYNPDLAGVGAGGDNGDGLRVNMAHRLVDQTLTAHHLTNATDQQRARLQTAAETLFRTVFESHRQRSDPATDLRGREFTGSTDPRQTYFRDVPLLGMDRVWSDITHETAPSDYSDLDMSDQASARMVTGAAFFRARYQAALPAFNTQADAVIGPIPPLNAPVPFAPELAGPPSAR